MGIRIKNAETIRLARELAATTGESITRAITEALRERLARIQATQERAAATKAAHLLEIGRDAAPRWIEPYRSVDYGDLLYDKRGLPR
jgi:antitoxin VapB